MIINTTTGSKISKLLQKKVNQQIKNQSRIISEYGPSIPVPPNAKTYDFVSGTGAKGKFNIFSFKDSEGNLINLFSRYLEDDDNFIDIITDIDKSSKIINRITQIFNGSFRNHTRHLNQIEHSSLQRLNEQRFIKSHMTKGPKCDFGGWDILKRGRKASGINFEYNWDGKPIAIEYKNTNGLKLDITEEESKYLPFFPKKFVLSERNGHQTVLTTDFTLYNYLNKINLSQIIQEQLHGIKENLLPRVKAVKSDDLPLVRNAGISAKEFEAKNGFLYYGEARANGQIYIAIDTPKGKEGLVILRKIAHEMQHEADYIKSYCGGKEALIEALKSIGICSDEAIKKNIDYYITNNQKLFNRCIEQNGLYKKGTPEYEEAVKIWQERLSYKHNYKTKEEHDMIEWEKRAINREKEQLAITSQIIAKINNFLQKL